MKNLTLNKLALRCSPIIICLLITATGCFGKGGKIKPPKVSNPESVSASCAQSAGLDEKDTAALTKAIKHYDGEFTDEFKLSAMTIISNSHTVDPARKDTVIKEYLTCVENSAQKK